MIRTTLRRKAVSQRGETLVEALAAILVSSLAILMLATAISTSRNIVVSSRDAIETYSNEGSLLAQHSLSGKAGTLSVSVSFSGTGAPPSFTVSDVPYWEAHVGSRTVAAYGKSES